MPLYSTDFENRLLTRINPVSYADAEIKERQDLQRVLAANVSSLDKDLILIAESFKGFANSLREIDILALDRNANLVVIELKRTDGGAHAELQAIRYAAMLSELNFDDVVKIKTDASGAPVEAVRQELRDFLLKSEEDDFDSVPVISDNPRILLIAPSFDREVARTCLWLIGNRIDIRCIAVILYQINGTNHLEIEQVIPLPSATEYQYRLREKQIQRADSEKKRKKPGERTVAILVKHGILKEGTEIRLIRTSAGAVPVNEIPDDCRQAIFDGNRKVRWKHDDQPYSISNLTEKICVAHGGKSGPIQGPDYWAIDGESVSLVERAKALASDLQIEASELSEEDLS